MNAYFPVTNEHITKRNKKVPFLGCPHEVFFTHSSVPKLLDYDAARNKLRKLIEKPSEDPTKLPKVRFSLFLGIGDTQPFCRMQGTTRER